MSFSSFVSLNVIAYLYKYPDERWLGIVLRRAWKMGHGMTNFPSLGIVFPIIECFQIRGLKRS